MQTKVDGAKTNILKSFTITTYSFEDYSFTLASCLFVGFRSSTNKRLNPYNLNCIRNLHKTYFMQCNGILCQLFIVNYSIFTYI